VRVDKKILPVGWTVSTIEDIADVNPRLNKAGIPDDLNISFVPMPAVGAESGSIDVSEERSFKEVKKGFTAFKEGDVLFAKITPCMENGKMAIVPKVKNDFGFGSTEFHVLRPKEGIDARYIYYYVSSKSFRGEAERYMTGAVGQRRVTTPYLKACEIPIAPPEQQKRIVGEIEKQFSRLDEAVANLKRVKANLKRYKAAVLKAAVEGKLLESGSKEKWPEEPIDVAIESLDQGWSPRCERVPSDDIKTWGVIKTSAVQSMSFEEKENKKLPAKLKPRLNLELRPGDLLITRAGPRKRVGVACLVKKTRPRLILCDKVYRIRCTTDVVIPEFLELVLNAPHIIDKLDELKTGISDSGVNLTQKRFRELIVPLPPLQVQARIIDEVQFRLTVNEELEKLIEDNLKRAERLRQSILSSAFSGKIIN